jgi:hypothetical protein
MIRERLDVFMFTLPPLPCLSRSSKKGIFEFPAALVSGIRNIADEVRAFCLVKNL